MNANFLISLLCLLKSVKRVKLRRLAKSSPEYQERLESRLSRRAMSRYLEAQSERDAHLNYNTSGKNILPMLTFKTVMFLFKVHAGGTQIL